MRNEKRSIPVARVPFPLSCLLIAFLFALLSSSTARPLCLHVKTLPLSNGAHWETRHNSLVFNHIDKYSSLEWRIWANVEDRSDFVDSFWPWTPSLALHNNSVLANGEFIHQKFAHLPKDHSFNLITEDMDSEAFTSLSIIHSGFGIDEHEFLKLDLKMMKTLEESSTPTTWPSTGEHLGFWNSARLHIEVSQSYPEHRYHRKFIGFSSNIAVDNCLGVN